MNLQLACNSCRQKYTGDQLGENCPACGTGILVDDSPPAVEEPHPTDQLIAARKLLFRQTEAVTRNAESLSTLSIVSFGVALLIVVITIWLALTDEHGTFSLAACAAAAGFLLIGFWLQVISQLLRLRAALERR